MDTHYNKSVTRWVLRGKGVAAGHIKNALGWPPLGILAGRGPRGTHSFPGIFRRRLAGKNVSPTKAERLYWDRLAGLGCIACRLDMRGYGYAAASMEPVSIHHISGRTSKGSHQNVIPLCERHHQTGGKDAPAIHPWKARFEAKYGTQKELKAMCDELLEKAV